MLRDNYTFSNTVGASIRGLAEDQEGRAQTFTASSSYNLKRVTVRLKRAGTPSGTASCKLLNGANGSVIATSSTSLDVATISTATGGVDYAFAFDNVPI
jgi:hypothetical protein